MSSDSKKPLDAKVQNIIDGVKARMPDDAKVTINNVTYDKPSLIAFLEGKLVPFQAAATAEATYRQKLVERDAAKPDANAVFKAVAALFITWFAGDATALADFGLTPPKPRRQLDAAELVAAAAKAKATRALRHTMKPTERAKLKAQGEFKVTATLNPPAAGGDSSSGGGGSSSNGSASGSSN